MIIMYISRLSPCMIQQRKSGRTVPYHSRANITFLYPRCLLSLFFKRIRDYVRNLTNIKTIQSQELVS